MLFRILLFFTTSLISINLSAETGNDVIDNIMRGLGIKYLVSEDRKLPKQDRENWEAGLSEYVDFKSLNDGMRQRIQDAINTHSESGLDTKTVSHLQDKAVLFLVPRQLSDYMLAYLKYRDKHGAIVSCSSNPKSSLSDALYFCQKIISTTERHINIYGEDLSELHASLIFKNQGRWVLSNIDGPVSEHTLMLVGRWK